MGEKSLSETHILGTLLAVMHGQLVTILAPMMINPVQCSSHLLDMSNIEAFCADAGVTSCCDVTQGEGLRLLETIAIAINDHITPPPGKLLKIYYTV